MEPINNDLAYQIYVKRSIKKKMLVRTKYAFLHRRATLVKKKAAGVSVE